MYTIYGQRIPYLLMDASLRWHDKNSEPNWLLVEIDLNQTIDLRPQHNIIPILNITDREKLKRYVGDLFDQGFSRIALSVDEDSAAIKSLSPRFSDSENRKRAKEQICKAIRECSSLGPTLVALTIEELCPGGLDPTDGIALAREFVACGAGGIIASGGTLDFLPLKMRRPTSLKGSAKAGDWPETWLSSALWLVGKIEVPVYAQGIVTHPAETQDFAARAGLSGVIDISVKYPSSSLTM